MKRLILLAGVCLWSAGLSVAAPADDAVAPPAPIIEGAAAPLPGAGGVVSETVVPGSVTYDGVPAPSAAYQGAVASAAPCPPAGHAGHVCVGVGCFHGGAHAAMDDPNLTPYLYCWHGYYSHTGWGTPVALVVPPTAEYETHWGWGVGNTRTTPIGIQFGRNYGGSSWWVPGAFRTTPRWPSDTDQFGVYSVRGPW